MRPSRSIRATGPALDASGQKHQGNQQQKNERRCIKHIVDRQHVGLLVDQAVDGAECLLGREAGAGKTWLTMAAGSLRRILATKAFRLRIYGENL